MEAKRRLMIFTDWFEPGYKAGGIIRSCSNFVQQMKKDYSIYIFTSDRDLNNTEPFQNIVPNRWTTYQDTVQIFYSSPDLLSWKRIRREISSIDPDFIYLNSMFSKYFSIYPLLMNKRGLINGKIILAPRGMLRESALRFKRTKKRLFLLALKGMQLQKGIRFHATDQTEWEDIGRRFGDNIERSLVPDSAGIVQPYPGSVHKMKGSLAIIFIGRMHPVKNLDYLLTLLPKTAGDISLTIVGSEEEASYVTRCKDMARHFPSRIQVRFTGGMPNHALPSIISRHHILALPTKGENFGHVIFEALAMGRPVLISDQTPWRSLAHRKAGWDIALAEEDRFVDALQQVIDFDQAQYDEWSRCAWEYVGDYLRRSDLKMAYLKLFS